MRPTNIVRASAELSARGFSPGAPAIGAPDTSSRTGVAGFALDCVGFTRKANRLGCRKRVDQINENRDGLSTAKSHLASARVTAAHPTPILRNARLIHEPLSSCGSKPWPFTIW